MSPGEAKRHPLDLAPVFASLEQPLALIDSPERRRDIQTYLAAARVHLERAILDLLSAALEAANQAGPPRVRLQYEAGTPVLVIEPGRAAEEAAAEGEPEPLFSFEGDMEKVTIRLPRELKELIDSAADLHGLSANSWYLRELGRTIAREMRRQRPAGDEPPFWRDSRRRRGRSLKGFVGDL